MKLTSTSIHRSNKSNLHNLAPLLSCTAVFLVTLLVAFLSGTVFLGISSSSAYDSWYEEIEVNLEVNQVISLTTDALTGSISIPITPTPTGALASNTLTVDVSTNNSTGYTLTMESITQPNQTSNLLGTALVHTILPEYSVLSTTTPIESPTTLPLNTWGYSNWTDAQISTSTTPTTFYRIPEQSSPDTIRITREPALESISKLTYAAYLNTNTASGTYSNTMLFSAVANDAPVLDYGVMQDGDLFDFDRLVCTTARGIATDGRNGQVVFVRRVPGSAVEDMGGMSGDLCWMETNLRYAGDGTNVESDPSHDDRYATSATNDTYRTNDDIRPLTQVSSSGSTPLAFDQAQYVDLSGSYPLNTSSDANGTAYYNNANYYGYLYNYCAAMGGMDEACNNTNDTLPGFYNIESICPSGWRLPSALEVERYATAIGATNDAAGSSNLRMNSLTTFSGSYSGGLSGQGTFGNIWTYTMASATDATNMNFTNTTVSPNSTSYKNSAYAIRCVARIQAAN